MPKIQNLAELKAGIEELQARQDRELPLLKEHFMDLADSLKPGNMIKSAFREIISTPELKSNVVKSAIGLTAGFLATKTFLGRTPNPLARLIIGSIAGMVTAGRASKVVSGIKSAGSNLLKKMFRKKNTTSEAYNGNSL